LLPLLPALHVPVAALLLVLWLAAPVVQAGRSAWRALAPFGGRERARWHRWPLTTVLHLLQPMARITGRSSARPRQWRPYRAHPLAFPRPRTLTVWCEDWSSTTQRLHKLEAAVQARSVTVLRGGDFERWDLHLKVGWLGGARLRMAVEEHGEGRQLLRFRVWPRWSAATVLASLALLALCGAALADRAAGPAIVTGLAAVIVVGRGLAQAATGLGIGVSTAERLEECGAHERLPGTVVGAPGVAVLEDA
jgi:hypothetical protein